MALELALTDKRGLSHPSAYWRVAALNLDFESETGRLVVHVFRDATAADRNDKKQPIAEWGIPITKEGTPAETQKDENGEDVLDGEGNPVVINPAIPPFSVLRSQVDRAEAQISNLAYNLLKQRKKNDVPIAEESADLTQARDV